MTSGYFLGIETGVMSSAPDNPRGFFERLDVVRLNDELLTGIGSSWASPPSTESVRMHRVQLASLIRPLFEEIMVEAAGRPVVINDPRFSVLLPTWQMVTGNVLLDVMMIRNPLDIALSLRKRNNFPVHFSLAL